MRLRFSRGAYSVGGVVLGLDWPGDTLSIFICQFSVLPKRVDNFVRVQEKLYGSLHKGM